MNDKTPSPFHLAGVALISGAFFGASCWRRGDPRMPRPWGWAAGIFAGVSLLTWLGLLSWWRSLHDADHGIATQPVPQACPEPYKITVISEDPSGAFMEGHYLERPISDEALKRTCKVLAEGGDFSHASFSRTGQAFDPEPIWGDYGSAFLRAKIACWKDENAHAQGLGLTLAGRRVVARG